MAGMDDYNQTTDAMMVDNEDSGIESNESGSRRDSLASVNSAATMSSDSAFGSMSDRRSSVSSNASSMSDMSDRSLSSRTSGFSSVGYPDSVSSSRRSSLSSVQSDDSTATIRSDLTATSGYTRVSTPYRSGPTITQPISELIDIQVVDYNGKTHIVRVRPTDKVIDLKVKIKEKLKMEPSQQQLNFQGKLLMDDRSTVHSCGLQNLSTVQLQGRLRGGKA